MTRTASLVAFVLAVAGALSGCATPSYERSHELDANLPRALGMGAFAPTCFFLCLVHAAFTRGGDENVNGAPDPEAGRVQSTGSSSIQLKPGAIKP